MLNRISGLAPVSPIAAMRKGAVLRPLLGLLLIVFLLAAPGFLGDFTLGLLALGLAYGLFAFGLDLAWGRAGIIAIGHAVYFGIGAYAVGVAISRGLPIGFGVGTGIAVAALLALAIALAGLRRGAAPSTMAVLSLAVCLLTQKLALNWSSLTGGSNGLFVMPPVMGTRYYYLGLTLAVGVVLAVWAGILRRAPGNRLAALRLNPVRAEHMGISVLRERSLAFVISAAISAAAGAYAAPLMMSITPDRVGIILSTQVLIWLATGGKGSILGPFIGAILCTWGQDAMAGSIGQFYLLILGALFVLVVLFLPDGLMGLLPKIRTIAPVLGRRLPHADTIVTENDTEPSAAPLLEVRDLRLAFQGNQVLNGATLTLTPREILCLIGANGAGKSTLLNCITGQLRPGEGAIRIGGADVTALRVDRRERRGLSRSFQVPSLFLGLTVGEHFTLARQQGYENAPLPEKYRALEEHYRNTPVEDLSLGDQRLVEIGMTICAAPKVLLLDEPAAGLDRQESRPLIRDLLALRDSSGCAIVCVEHDMEIVRSLADRVICLHRGAVISEGSMDEVSEDPAVRASYLGQSAT